MHKQITTDRFESMRSDWINAVACDKCGYEHTDMSTLTVVEDIYFRCNKCGGMI